MNKQKFLQLVKDHKSIGKEDLPEINDSEKSYPYSQVLHVLNAVATHQHKTKDAKEKLSLAAVYATDRKVLKDVILASEQVEQEDRKNELTEIVQVKKSHSSLSSQHKPSRLDESISAKPLKKVVIKEPSNYPGRLSAKEAENLRDEVIINLEKLLEVKQEYFGIPVPKAKIRKQEIESSPKQTTAGKKTKKTPSDKTIRSDKATSTSSPKTSKKENTKKAIEDPKPKLTVTKSAKKPTKKKILKIAESSDESVKSAKIEQQVIIEKFIKADPKIKRGASKKTKKSQNDLSVPSVEFGEDLVSENLAQVLIKQGKKNKAIDIYKKLIWKYPQKKAYFASQIESLKEK